MLTLPKIQAALENAGRGTSNLPPKFREEFIESVAASIQKQFSRPSDKSGIRMSGLGRPLCQQQHEIAGDKEMMDYTTFMRFIFGDMIESLAVLAMRMSGVEIVDLQKKVELELDDDIKISGTLDIIIDDGSGPKVWDIKSASDYSFNHKFGAFGGYEKIKEDDTFGYVMQGYLYSTAVGLIMCPAPDDQEQDRKQYIADAKARAKYLLSNKPFRKEFQPEKEMHKGEPTGNMLMPRTCSFCGHKSKCWPKAKFAPKATSRAQSRPGTWYTKLAKESVV